MNLALFDFDGTITFTDTFTPFVDVLPLRDYPVVYAYGDTAEDHEMLSLANRKHFRWREIAD